MNKMICENCANNEYKDRLICCAANEVHYAFTELLRNVPFFGQSIKEYECKAFEDKEIFDFKIKNHNKYF